MGLPSVGNHVADGTTTQTEDRQELHQGKATPGFLARGLRVDQLIAGGIG